jgi:glycosyltransferase involved in cell wall biosynthesis
VRPARLSDAAGIARVMRSAIRVLARGAYSAERIRAWSSLPPLYHAWAMTAGRERYLVAEARGVVVGYAALLASEVTAVFVRPSLYEPFGWAVLEAGRAGCALVLGDIPSLREVWSDAAVFVPARDHQALAREVNRLIAEEDVRRQYGARDRARAQTYTMRRMAGEYYRDYRDLMQKELVTSEGALTGVGLRMAWATRVRGKGAGDASHEGGSRPEGLRP